MEGAKRELQGTGGCEPVSWPPTYVTQGQVIRLLPKPHTAIVAWLCWEGPCRCLLTCALPLSRLHVHMQRSSLFLTLFSLLSFESSPRHPPRADELLSCTFPNRAKAFCLNLPVPCAVGTCRLVSQRLLCPRMLLQLVLKAWLDNTHTTSRAPSCQPFPPKLGSLWGCRIVFLWN